MFSEGNFNVPLIFAYVEIIFYHILDVITAACTTTKRKYEIKMITANVVATSVRIVLLVRSLISNLIHGDTAYAIGYFIILLFNLLYLLLTVLIRKRAIATAASASRMKEYMLEDIGGILKQVNDIEKNEWCFKW